MVTTGGESGMAINGAYRDRAIEKKERTKKKAASFPPSHAKTQSRAHALAACSLRAVTPGLSSMASRRRTWSRAGLEIGSSDDNEKRRVRQLGTLGGS